MTSMCVRDNSIMESKEVRSQRLKQYVSKKRLAASERARKRWSNTVSSQRCQGESSFGPVTLDEPVIAVPPGSASTPPGEGYLMPYGGNTTFQPGSAPAVPGKSGAPSPIGEIGSQDISSTGTAPEEVSLAAHVSSVQGGIDSSVSSVVGGNTSVVCSPVVFNSQMPSVTCSGWSHSCLYR